MSATLLFEQLHRGEVWRLEVAEHQGRTFGNWRKWYWADGELKPTRQGVTFPVERLAELGEAISGWSAANVPDRATGAK